MKRVNVLSIGERVLEIRKALNLTQEEFANRLRINKGTISNLEKDRQNPSEQLIRLICLEFVVSEDWLKIGKGEMFISPENVIKQQMARLGERPIIEAFNNIMKERGLAVATGRQGQKPAASDPDLDRMINTLYDLWSVADEKLKGWIETQFDFAFPPEKVAAAQKKHTESYKRLSAGEVS